MKKIFFQLILVSTAVHPAFAEFAPGSPGKIAVFKTVKYHKAKRMDTATFAAGCFWCTEAQFKQLSGVKSVVSGYTGGHVKNPSYKEVCTGATGHAEACNIIYDPSQISFDELLAAFFTAHDPTQLNRQGNDVGTQYRSAVFYHTVAQRGKAVYYINKLDTEKAYKDKIVTEVTPYILFYKAEDYHQNFYDQNPNQHYCKFVIQPELEKFRKVFKNKLKQQWLLLPREILSLSF